MIKKYKLIKKYPGSPEVGWELNDVSCCILGYTHLSYEKYVSNYPEFWQEIIKKDYEILSFIRINHIEYKGLIKTKDVDGLFKWDYTNNAFTEDFLLDSTGFAIHSVKRLSDGEVFTVGDTVLRLKTKVIIEKFKFENERLHVYFSNGNANHLNEIFHIKKPLFTTEDGVDIFEGDEFVITSNFKLEMYRGIPFIADKATTVLNNRKYFSTKKAAEEYILYNKPCLSINDVKNSLTYSNELKKLRKIAKSKL